MLTPGVDVLDSGFAPVASFTSSVPGSISGVAQVRFQVPVGVGAFQVTPVVVGKGFRERLVLVWAR
jgi:hypothetical protein